MTLRSRSELDMVAVRGLAETGDIDLGCSRTTYKSHFGLDTTLSDDDILACHAAQDDDYGTTDLMTRMAQLQDGNEAGAFSEGDHTWGDDLDDYACYDITVPVQHFFEGLLTADEMRDQLVANLAKLRRGDSNYKDYHP